jgi:hypothetical protein
MSRAYETFGDERAIQFVVMATPDDLKVNAEYIRMADKYVEVPGGSNNHVWHSISFLLLMGPELRQCLIDRRYCRENGCPRRMGWMVRPPLSYICLTCFQGTCLREPKTPRKSRQIEKQSRLHRPTWLRHEIPRRQNLIHHRRPIRQSPLRRLVWRRRR